MSEITGLSALTARLARIGGGLPFVAGIVLRREAETIMTASKRKFVPVDIGPLKANGFVQPAVVTQAGVSVTLGYGGAAAGYAVYVHEGTGPAVGRPAFMPPVSVIRDWAKRHNIPEDAAFPIARAIGRRGLRPLKYLERPLNEARAGMETRLAAALAREVARLSGGG